MSVCAYYAFAEAWTLQSSEGSGCRRFCIRGVAADLRLTISIGLLVSLSPSSSSSPSSSVETVRDGPGRDSGPRYPLSKTLESSESYVSAYLCAWFKGLVVWGLPVEGSRLCLLTGGSITRRGDIEREEKTFCNSPPLDVRLVPMEELLFINQLFPPLT